MHVRAGGQMREVSKLSNKLAGGRPARRIGPDPLARMRARVRVGARMGARLGLAVILCGPVFAYGQNNNKKNKQQKGKESRAAASTASLLPENQPLDLLVSQILGPWQAPDVESMHK